MSPIVPGIVGSSDGRQPDTPVIGSATAGNASASVAFTAPAYLGKPNTNNIYIATSSPSGITGTATTPPISVTGLTNGTAYTFTVSLRTRDSVNTTIATSLSSGSSNSVTPIAPPPPIIATPPPIIAIIATPPPPPPIIAGPPPIIAIIATPPPPPPPLPPTFTAGKGSLGANTLVRTPTGLVRAQDLMIGDELLSLDIPGIPQDFTTLGITPETLFAQEWPADIFDTATPVTTTINDIQIHEKTGAVVVNEDMFTGAHFIWVLRDGVAKIVTAADLLETDQVYNFTSSAFEPIYDLQFLDVTYFAYSINCEPYDFYWTEKMFTFDNIEWYPGPS